MNERESKMRTLVTGGAGFIGSHLCEALVKQGYDVSIIDNLFRGKRENIEHLLNDRNRFYKIDLSLAEEIANVAGILAQEKPELIFHYAAINGTQYFYDIPGKVMEVNSQVSYCFMKSVKEAKINNPDWSPKIIYSSSSEVYGEPSSLPTKEDDVTYVNVNHVRDSYAASKLMGEFYVKLMSEELNISWIVLRLFNVYGPHMIGTKYGQVIPEFIKRLSEGEYPLRVYGDGNHKRSFCYISDNVDYTLALALSNAAKGVYNIGNTQEVSINDLGSLIMRKINREPKFIYLPEREGDHKRRCPDITKLSGVIPIDGFVTLDEGVEKMIMAMLQPDT
jgi:nucleoside-diphosphate-sugar epimerase